VIKAKGYAMNQIIENILREIFSEHLPLG
jgi:hypothetical protein